MRLAFFGGTFDPPHRGHTAIARAAADAFHLDKVLFAPAGRQPLKLEGRSSSFADRLEMTTLACSDVCDRRFEASGLDAPQPDGSPNYTVETLARLAALFPHASLFSLIGADNFRNLVQWREPQRLLSLAEWIVISRPGFPLEQSQDLRLNQEQRSRIHLLNGVHEEVSATALRTRLGAGETCADFISPSVAAYIADHGLYSGERSQP